MSAAILNKFMGMLGIDSVDEDVEDVENEYEEQSEEVNDKYSKSRSGYNREEYRSSAVRNQPKILPMAGTVATSKMVITKPTCFEDVEEIGNYLKQRKSVIVNLESVNKEDGRRVLDFLGGAAFALEGTVQKVSTLIYLVTPKTVEIQNDVERAEYRSKLSFSWLK